MSETFNVPERKGIIEERGLAKVQRTGRGVGAIVGAHQIEHIVGLDKCLAGLPGEHGPE
jgi:hypothetical protein